MRTDRPCGKIFWAGPVASNTNSRAQALEKYSLGVRRSAPSRDHLYEFADDSRRVIELLIALYVSSTRDLIHLILHVIADAKYGIDYVVFVCA